LCSRLEACDIFCRDSTRFRSFEDDLVPKEQWQREKTLLISNTTIAIFKLAVKEHLDYLQQLLEEKLAIVNQRIASGENQHIQIKTNNRWTLPYPSANESTNHPFFDSSPQTEIKSILHLLIIIVILWMPLCMFYIAMLKNKLKTKLLQLV